MKHIIIYIQILIACCFNKSTEKNEEKKINF